MHIPLFADWGLLDGVTRNVKCDSDERLPKNVAGEVLKFKQSWRQNISLAPRSCSFAQKRVWGTENEEREVGMKRQQHRKNYPRGIRSAGGQTTLQSFLVKPRLRIKSTRRFSDSHLREDLFCPSGFNPYSSAFRASGLSIMM